MTSNKLLFAILSFALSACAAESGPAAVLDCSTEQLDMDGAFVVNTPSAATFLVNRSIIGVAGFGDSNGTTSYSLTLRDPFVGELGTIGIYDVATHPLKYLVAPANADCQAAGACSGFVATAGTFEVLAVQPLYRASFTLETLSAYDGSSAAPGAAIAGQVMGCVTAAAP